VNNVLVQNQSLQTVLGIVLDGSQGVGEGASMHFTASRAGNWAKGFGGFGRANGDSIESYGGVAGYGQAIQPNLVLGAAFSGTGTSTSNVYQNAAGRSFGLYGYGIYTEGHLRLSGDLGGGYLSLDTHRNLYPTGLTADGSTNGWFLGMGAQAQYLIPMGRAFLIPYGRVRYLHTDLGAFTEHGAGLLDLTTAAVRTNIGSFTGGLRTGMDLRAAGGLSIIPWAEVGGTGNVGDTHIAVQQTLLGLNGATNMANALVASSGVLDTGAGLTLKEKGSWTAKFAYNGQFAADTHLNTFSVLVNYRW
jgi:uncharacterized protein YhjY with autotransporter beta-barrel domain